MFRPSCSEAATDEAKGVIYLTLGKAIRERRKQMGLTQAQLAEKAGFHRVRISEWEHDVTRGIEARSIAKLEQALQVEPGELFLIYRAANQ